MIVTSRRSWLCGALLALAFPAVRTFGATPSPAHGRFDPPAGPMRFRRHLVREMRDGFAFIVTRDFAIRFLANERGYRVEGNQIGAKVDAPEALATFARIEEERVETGIFPLQLTGEGVISEATDPSVGPWLDEAVAEARRMMASLDLDAAEAREVDRFISAIHNRAMAYLPILPDDIFAPRHTERSDTRSLDMAAGEQGHVSTHWLAEVDATSGLMRQVDRRIVTTMGGQSRETHESWSLVPL